MFFERFSRRRNGIVCWEQLLSDHLGLSMCVSVCVCLLSVCLSVCLSLCLSLSLTDCSGCLYKTFFINEKVKTLLCRSHVEVRWSNSDLHHSFKVELGVQH